MDFSQVAIAGIFVFYDDISKSSKEEVKNIIRHATLTSIKSYKKQYGKIYGDLIICCDSTNVWRKEKFKYYKFKRQKAKQESTMDWNFIYQCMNDLREDLKNHFPYKVIQIDTAEGDDIIGTLSRYISENETGDGLYAEEPNILIVSSDKDYIQLHDILNLKQWAPASKKWVESPKDIKKSMIEHIIRAGDDGIPSVLSPDDVFFTGTRQKPLMKARVDEFLEKGIEACRNDDERKHYERNRELIDFSYIPKDLKKTIIDAYINTKPNKDKMRLMTYLMNNDCNMLLQDIQDF